MIQKQPKHQFYTLLVFIFYFSSILCIIESCKKDTGNQQKRANLDQSVEAAKKWYENNFPINNESKLSNQSIINGSTNIDYSQFIKPDWQNALSYNRFNNGVIEIPIDSSFHKLSTALSTNPTGTVFYKKEYSRSSILLIQNQEDYDAYVMTVIADPNYLKNDISKLEHDKYNQRYSDFSGIVLYNTLKGKFVSGWFYKNGRIINILRPHENSGQHSATQVESLTNNDLQVDCTAWYQQVDNGDGTSSWIYLDTTCVVTGSAGGGTGDGGPASPSPPNGGGSPGNPSNPNPQPCEVSNSVGISSDNGTLISYKNVVQPPGDGDGTYPPPPPPPVPQPCPTDDATIITNGIKNPCLKNMVKTIISVGVDNQINTLIQDVFGGSTTTNLTFTDISTLDAGVEGHTEMNGGIDAKGNLNVEIQLNSNELPNYSQQYIATVIMHEAMHAYLESKGVDPLNQHEEIIIDYITKMATSLQQMFPGLSTSDAKNLALGGLQNTTTFKYTIANDMKLSGDFAATQSAYSIGSLGNRCK